MPEILLNNEDNERISSSTDTADQSVLARKIDKPEFLAIKYTFTPTRGDMGGAFCLIFDQLVKLQTI